MSWIVVEDQDGSWESFTLQSVESISFDGQGTAYVFRKNFPPRGVQLGVIRLSDGPATQRPSDSGR